MRGLAKGLIGKYNATSQEFGKAFEYGILYAQKAVPEEKNRPIIVASKVMAKGAYDAAQKGGYLNELVWLKRKRRPYKGKKIKD